jgi:hypothetical protein
MKSILYISTILFSIGILLLPKLQRASMRFSSPLAVAEKEVVGVWVQSIPKTITRQRDNSSTRPVQIKFRVDGKFTLMIGKSDETSKELHEGKWYYYSAPIKTILLNNSGYRNWIALYQNQFKSPQFYMSKNKGEITLIKANFNDKITNDPFIKAD